SKGQNDIVAIGVGGEKTINTVGGEEALVDDAAEHGLGLIEELAGGRAEIWVVEDARVLALHLVGEKEGRPVYIAGDLGQRIVAQNADAGEGGGGNIDGGPIGLKAASAGFGYGGQLHITALVGVGKLPLEL